MECFQVLMLGHYTSRNFKGLGQLAIEFFFFTASLAKRGTSSYLALPSPRSIFATMQE